MQLCFKIGRGAGFVIILIALFLVTAGCSKESKEVAETSGPTTDSASLKQADDLAAHPADPTKPKEVAGVTDDELLAADALEKAADACMAAIEKNPDEARCHFELGRVLALGGLNDEARAELEQAAEKGHGGALFYLAQLEDDLGQVKDLLERSAAANFKPATEMLAHMSTAESSPALTSDESGDSGNDGGRLRSQEVKALEWSMLGPITDVPLDMRDSVAVEVEEIIHSDQKILVCSYGSSDSEKRTFRFWYQLAPPKLDAMFKRVEKHPLRRLGVKAFDKPPNNLEEASRAHESK
jgi:tetratricopeptide (TPR) repeat protein